MHSSCVLFPLHLDFNLLLPFEIVGIFEVLKGVKLNECMHCFMVTSEQNETEKALQLCNVTKHFLLDNLATHIAKNAIF